VIRELETQCYKFLFFFSYGCVLVSCFSDCVTVLCDCLSMSVRLSVCLSVWPLATSSVGLLPTILHIFVALAFDCTDWQIK